MSGPSKIDVSNFAGEIVFSEDSVDLDMTILAFKQKVSSSVAMDIQDFGLLWNGDRVATKAKHEELLGSVFAGQDSVTLLLVSLFQGEVYFYRIAACNFVLGLSAKHCFDEGRALSNADTDRFKKISAEGGYVFESVTHPGRCMFAEGGSMMEQKVTLRKKESSDSMVFRELPAINGDPNKLTLESVAYPGRFICQGPYGDGQIYCWARDEHMQDDDTYINDASWYVADADKE